jgi:excisionase family DNA binding protein
MNQETGKTFTITVHGQLTLERSDLEHLLRELNLSQAEANQPVANKTAPVIESKGAGMPVPRLAYSLRETAEILGVHYQTVYRLLKRGLLRSSGALRCKIIPKTEIERFLRESSRSLL